MKRIEGASHPLTYVQMASSCGTVLIALLAAYFWLIAAYREETSPANIQLLNDFAWITFIAAAVGLLAIAFAKIWLIVRYFMEVRFAPLWLRLVLDARVAGVFVAITALYLTFAVG